MMGSLKRLSISLEVPYDIWKAFPLALAFVPNIPEVPDYEVSRGDREVCLGEGFYPGKVLRDAIIALRKKSLSIVGNLSEELRFLGTIIVGMVGFQIKSLIFNG